MGLTPKEDEMSESITIKARVLDMVDNPYRIRDEVYQLDREIATYREKILALMAMPPAPLAI